MVVAAASLIVFPEGSRTRDGRVGRFKGGIFLLAIENGLPIVPVSVVRQPHVMPKGRLMTCPATCTVTMHAAIPTTGMTRADAGSWRRALGRARAARRRGAPMPGAGCPADADDCDRDS